MTPIKTFFSFTTAAATVVAGLIAPMAGAVVLLASPSAHAQAGCYYVVGPPGQGDSVECPHDGPGFRPQPEKPDVWGAIAATPQGGWGSSWNYLNEGAASTAALQACRQHAGVNAGCRVLRTVADTCLALVTSFPEKRTFVGGPAGAGNFAENNARLQCKQAGGRSCQLKTIFCADGQQHVLQGHTVISNGNPIFVPDGGAPFGRR